MERIDVDGVPVAVEDPGGAGRPLVWCHGLTSSRAHEDDTGLFGLAAGLAGGPVRLIRFDAPGHGASGGRPDPQAYRWDRLGRVLLGVADAVGLDRVALGGASMGSAAALVAALAAPGRVDALVLAVPPTAWASRPDQAALYEAGADLVDAAGPAGLAATVRGSAPASGYGARGDELLEISARHVAAMDPALLAHVLRGAAASDLPPLEDVAAIEVPALVLAIAGDPTHPVATAEALADALPRAELVVADDLGAVVDWPARVAAFLGPV